MDRRSKSIRVRPAGDDHLVVTVKSDSKSCRRKPCPKCPWRKDAVGEFPAEAFRHSAETSYDMAGAIFGCHDAGTERATTCAGFILRGADHNLAFRLQQIEGHAPEVTDGGNELFDSYREMAIANGVDEDDPCLVKCR